jgi:hypothetical protein
MVVSAFVLETTSPDAGAENCHQARGHGRIRSMAKRNRFADGLDAEVDGTPRA